MNGITTGLAFLTGLGLPHILLWVLTFAVVFAILTKARIFSRAPAALVSIVAGIFVLMAVPTALISVIASMSTALLVIAVGVLVFISLIFISGATHWKKVGDKEQAYPWHMGHGTAIAAVILVLAAIVFFVSGGASLIGIGMPAFGWGTWLLILVGVAVLWMLSETE